MGSTYENFAKNSFAFGTQLYHHFSKEGTSENVVFSPYSIQTCLTMALLGAQGQTADELQSSLNYSNTKDVLEYLKRNLEFLKNEGISMANRLYVNDSLSQVKSEFNKLAEMYFESTIGSINFGDSVTAAKTINTWIEEQTQNCIKNLISNEMLNHQTQAVLINAIHFKGKWKHRFDANNTVEKEFWINTNQQVLVKTMNATTNFRYAELPELHAAAIELPYRASNTSMIIILPKEKDGLALLESKIGDICFSEMSDKMKYAMVNVSLPKFEFEYKVLLSDVLKSMGVKHAFDQSSADFSGILESSSFALSEVVHKAFIRTDEEGTEAAAATASVFLDCLIVAPEAIEFKVDHPFMFILQSANLPLFVGSIKTEKALSVN